MSYQPTKAALFAILISLWAFLSDSAATAAATNGSESLTCFEYDHITPDTSTMICNGNKVNCKGGCSGSYVRVAGCHENTDEDPHGDRISGRSNSSTGQSSQVCHSAYGKADNGLSVCGDGKLTYTCMGIPTGSITCEQCSS